METPVMEGSDTKDLGEIQTKSTSDIKPCKKMELIHVHADTIHARWTVSVDLYGTVADLVLCLKKKAGFSTKKLQLLWHQKYIYPYEWSAHEGYDHDTTLFDLKFYEGCELLAIENVTSFNFRNFSSK